MLRKIDWHVTIVGRRVVVLLWWWCWLLLLCTGSTITNVACRIGSVLPVVVVSAFTLGTTMEQGTTRYQSQSHHHHPSQSGSWHAVTSASRFSIVPVGINPPLVSDFYRSFIVAHLSRNSNNNDKLDVFVSNRRSILQKLSATVITTTSLILLRKERANAEIVDATDIFADNDWSSTTGTRPTPPTSKTYTPTDEIQIRINRRKLKETYQNRLGLELVDIEFRNNLRVRVKSVQPGSASQQLLQIQPDWIVVSINGRSMERTNAAGVRQYLMEAIQQQPPSTAAADDIVVVFRDPSLFQSQLRTNNGIINDDDDDESLPTVTTQIGPRGDTTPRNPDGTVRAGQSVTTADTDQRLTVVQLLSPNQSKVCTHGAEINDLLEISYTGTVVETGQIFDGSAVLIDGQGIPGRGNDISIFFVLGKQPSGQFPPGWDVGLVGMCAGERRRLILPPALAYGNKGLSRRNIPPNATLQYDITLVSINGLAI